MVAHCEGRGAAVWPAARAAASRGPKESVQRLQRVQLVLLPQRPEQEMWRSQAQLQLPADASDTCNEALNGSVGADTVCGQ